MRNNTHNSIYQRPVEITGWAKDFLEALVLIYIDTTYRQYADRDKSFLYEQHEVKKSRVSKVQRFWVKTRKGNVQLQEYLLRDEQVIIEAIQSEPTPERKFYLVALKYKKSGEWIKESLWPDIPIPSDKPAEPAKIPVNAGNTGGNGKKELVSA